MKRVIYDVYAVIVDSNGTCNTLSGYPKRFDSRNYDNDTNKTLLRATGEFSDTYGAMCKRDDRQMQSVFLLNVEGMVLDAKVVGKIPEDPDSEPEVEE